MTSKSRSSRVAIFPPYVDGEPKGQSSFIFYVDSSSFPMLTEVWYEDSLPAGMVFHFSLLDLLFTFLLPALFPRRLISIIWFCVTPLSPGQHEESLDQQAGREAGVFISLLPPSQVTDLEWLPFSDKSQISESDLSPSAIAIDLVLLLLFSH